MSLPLTTTTLTIRRAQPHGPYESATWDQVAELVGHIGQPSSIERRDLGGRSVEIVALGFVPAGSDVRLADTAESALGPVYDVAGVDEREGLGLGHTKLWLSRHEGAPAR